MDDHKVAERRDEELMVKQMAERDAKAQLND